MNLLYNSDSTHSDVKAYTLDYFAAIENLKIWKPAVNSIWLYVFWSILKYLNDRKDTYYPNHTISAKIDWR